MTNPDDLLTVKEVAARLDISRQRVHQLIDSGALEAVRLGRAVGILPESLTALQARRNNSVIAS